MALIATLFLAVVAVFVPSAQAAPAPIVFDFEDGLQGWELHGATQRVQTQVLGGEWAIFGDGFIEGEATLITLPTLPEEFPLGDFSVSWDMLFLDGDKEGPWLVTFDIIDNPFFGQTTISWRIRSVDVPVGRVVAFIDNITFHPVPEPSTLALLAFSLVALVIARRRIV